MDRKHFLATSALAAFSLSTFGRVMRNSSGELVGDCETTNDILGPFYRPDAPQRNDLTFTGLAGNRIQLQGRILDEDCTTPMKGALVEIWHCDTEGRYDNSSAEFRHRGSWLTGADGAYSFLTILPGKYLNGDLYRPSHIHYRVTHPGSRELVSQIYFSGDPHIKEDPWASDPKAVRRILPLLPQDINGNISILFDVTLKRKS
jgi:protocatechuate 3,4-dioxygenase beta subunit